VPKLVPCHMYDPRGLRCGLQDLLQQIVEIGNASGILKNLPRREASPVFH